MSAGSSEDVPARRVHQAFTTGEYVRPVQVTVTDPDTGEVLGEKLLNNDYVLIVQGRRYLKSMQVWGRTHQLNVAYDTTPTPPDTSTDQPPS